MIFSLRPSEVSRGNALALHPNDHLEGHTMMQRRQFLANTAGLAAGLFSSGLWAGADPAARPKVAFLGTSVYRHSHAQHFLDRLCEGYAWGGEWKTPRVEVASVYIDQFPEQTDLGRNRIERYKLKQFKSVKEALTLGGSKLAVDGVVIIAEHGDFPKNEKGQTLYPRYKWFKEAVQVFEESGRSVPIFNDKHLSTDWKECVEMVSDSKRLKFPFIAGSSLPVTWRLPSVDMPLGADLRESVCVCYGGVDSYDFHGYETAQCMSERRKGGEVGIRSVHALKGDALWSALEAPERQVTQRLFVSGLNRSHSLPVEGGFPTAKVTYEWAKATMPNTTGFFVEHCDGFRTTMFLTDISDFNYAGAIGDSGETIGCQMYLPMPGRGASTADFFNSLVRSIENVVLTGEVPYPVERTLLTSGMVIGGVDSLFAGKKVETPEMAVAYKVGEASTYWRE
ncbi:MAG: hypothetical protein DWH81_08595 [Planctomycetota bacterium]|nr:MAG: hypothetical protein DWH81_08595 [Planctomycetota bacterium]